MRLTARLAKLERLGATGRTEFSKLSEEELLEHLKKNVEQIGIDWVSFKNDPAGTTSDFCKGLEDEDGLIEGFLAAIKITDVAWLQGL